ncbi:hypothetical protein [Phenylobacterium sp.]|jgi:hypothetical protein|uniref:hypothetical protein n=1 Tax=Phenylobacterium sp. TaxID=1871053 RepID=UPI0037C67267
MQIKIRSAVQPLILTMALCAPLVAMAQDASLLKNGGFEDLQPGSPETLQAWRPDKAESGYVLTTQDVHDGKQALEIGFDEKTSTVGYAGTIQSIALPDLAGRTLAVSGWLKRSNVASTAGLWMAFFDADGKRSVYVNDYDKPWIDARGWNLRTIRAKAPVGTVRMLIGASISDKSGKLLVDAITMEAIQH